MPRPTVVVDQIFAITTASDPTAGLKDALISLVFANAAARAQRSSDPENSVDTFRNAWSSAMGNVGWVITSAGNSQISTQSSRGTTSVADRIMMNAPSSAIETAVDQLKDLSHETGNSDDLLEMWWEAGRQFKPFYASLAAVDIDPDSIVLELAQFSVDLGALEVPDGGVLFPREKPLHPKSPAAFFENVLENSIDMSVYHIRCELNLQVFGTQRRELEKKLGDKFFDHFRTLPEGLLGEAP